MRNFTPPKPPVGYYHYSNPSCQGALLRETKSFPNAIDNDAKVADGYYDRIQGWHPKGYKAATELFKDQWYITALKSITDDELREYAQVMFELDWLPDHVRIIYYYNVATGYDCPYIIAVKGKGIYHRKTYNIDDSWKKQTLYI